MDHEAAKFIAGVIGAAVGGFVMVMGWRRSKAARYLGLGTDESPVRPPAWSAEERPVLRGEWHDLRDKVHNLRWSIDQLNRDLARVEGGVEGAMDDTKHRLALLEAALDEMKHRVASMSRHCDHCPPGRRS